MEILNTLILAAHVIGATLIVGSLFVSTLALSSQSIPRTHLELLEKLWKILYGIIGIQIFTGVYLVIVEWDEFRRNPLLWTKVVLLLIDGFIGSQVVGSLVKQSLVTKNTMFELPSAKRAAMISLFIFLLLTTFGVLLAE